MAGVLRFVLTFGCVFAVHLLSEQHVLCAKGLTRDGALGIYHANFVKHPFHYLNVSQGGSSLVNDIEDCMFACIRAVSCFSFNVAEHVNEHILCELLASDKYNSSDKFEPSQRFHHYSIYTPCSENPCAEGGKCIALYARDDFMCKCPPGFIGKKCKTADPTSFDLNFTKETTTDYVIHQGLLLSNAFTVCYRVRRTEPASNNYVFSYAAKGSRDGNGIALRNGGGKIRLDVDDSKGTSNFIDTADGSWHHVCASWENVKGEYKFYRDGVLQGGGVDLKKGHVIDPTGVLVIGQDQDTVGFEAFQCYIGELTDLNVWDQVLSADQISEMSRSCHGFEGNVKKWADFRVGIQGSVKMLSPSACKPMN